MTLGIVVLGATGALRSHVVRQALQAGHAVTAIVRKRVGLALPEGMRHQLYVQTS